MCLVIRTLHLLFTPNHVLASVLKTDLCLLDLVSW
jgi:hypothetical protein